MLIASLTSGLHLPGQLGLGAHLVRGLPGAQLLPEEPADQRDAHRHPVPLPVLDGPRHPQLRSDSAGLPQVRARTAALSPARIQGPSSPTFNKQTSHSFLISRRLPGPPPTVTPLLMGPCFCAIPFILGLVPLTSFQHV